MNTNNIEKVELLDRISVHDEDWLITDGDHTAVGIYSCGELVAYSDVEKI